jgi:lysophospholipase L1-like esterase
VVFLGAGGDRVRVRLTNTFGTRPLVVDGATVAVRSGGADAVPGTVRKLTFRGSHRVSVPVGEQLFSDSVRPRVKTLSTLLVSVRVPGPTGPVTNHPFTARTTYLAEGNHAPAVSGGAYGTTPCWMLTDGVDVRSAGRVTGTVVAFGDSITDTGSTTGDADQRFPDHLARRLAAVPGHTLSAVNGGPGGNRLLADREGEPYYGPSALSRTDRDVFGQTGARAAIVLLGVNDIGYSASAEEIVGGYRKVIERGRQRGVKVYGGTLLPIHGSFVWTEERGKTWQTVNEWIRTSGEFDGVVDFAEATAAPGDPLTLHPAYDSGDHLHPNDAGTRAMADAVDGGRTGSTVPALNSTGAVTRAASDEFRPRARSTHRKRPAPARQEGTPCRSRRSRPTCGSTAGPRRPRGTTPPSSPTPGSRTSSTSAKPGRESRGRS